MFLNKREAYNKELESVDAYITMAFDDSVEKHELKIAAQLAEWGVHSMNKYEKV